MKNYPKFPNIQPPSFPIDISYEDIAIRSKKENGDYKLRKKFSRSRKTFTVKWNAMSHQDYKLLEDFFINVTSTDVEEFIWTYPTVIYKNLPSDIFNGKDFVVRFVSLNAKAVEHSYFVVNMVIMESFAEDMILTPVVGEFDTRNLSFCRVSLNRIVQGCELVYVDVKRNFFLCVIVDVIIFVHGSGGGYATDGNLFYCKCFISLNRNLIEYQKSDISLNRNLIEYQKNDISLNRLIVTDQAVNISLNRNLIEYQKNDISLNRLILDYLFDYLYTDISLNRNLTEYQKSDISLNRNLIEYQKSEVSLNRLIVTDQAVDISLNRNLIEYQKSDISLNRNLIEYQKSEVSLNRLIVTDQVVDISLNRNLIEYQKNDISLNRNLTGYEDTNISLNRNLIEYQKSDISLNRNLTGYEDTNISLNRNLIEYQKSDISLNRLIVTDQAVNISLNRNLIGYKDTNISLNRNLIEYQKSEVSLNRLIVTDQAVDISLNRNLTGYEDTNISLNRNLIEYQKSDISLNRNLIEYQKSDISLNRLIVTNQVVDISLNRNLIEYQKNDISLNRLIVTDQAVNISLNRNLIEYQKTDISLSRNLTEYQKSDISLNRNLIEYQKSEVSLNRLIVTDQAVDISLNRNLIEYQKSDISLNRNLIEYQKSEVSLNRLIVTDQAVDISLNRNLIEYQKSEVSLNRLIVTDQAVDISLNRNLIEYQKREHSAYRFLYKIPEKPDKSETDYDKPDSDKPEIKYPDVPDVDIDPSNPDVPDPDAPDIDIPDLPDIPKNKRPPKDSDVDIDPSNPDVPDPDYVDPMDFPDLPDIPKRGRKFRIPKDPIDFSKKLPKFPSDFSKQLPKFPSDILEKLPVDLDYIEKIYRMYDTIKDIYDLYKFARFIYDLYQTVIYVDTTYEIINELYDFYRDLKDIYDFIKIAKELYDIYKDEESSYDYYKTIKDLFDFDIMVIYKDKIKFEGNDIHNDSNSVTIVGGDKHNIIVNTGEDVIVDGLGGNDYILNSGNNSTLIGSDGNDVIVNTGSNVLIDISVSILVESLLNVEFDDTIVDIVVDVIDALSNNVDKKHSDLNISNYGNNVSIYAGDGNDTIINYGDSITVSSGLGNDYIANEGSNVSIYSGEGNDTIVNYGDSVTVSSSLDNDYIANEGNNVFVEFNSENTIINSGSNVSIYSGDGNNTINNYGDNVSVYSSDVEDYIFNVGANATICVNNSSIVNSGEYAVINGSDNDCYIVNGGNNTTINGSEKTDEIINSGNDVYINSGKGNEIILNTGTNVLFDYYSGDGLDVIVGFDNSSTLRIFDSTYYTLKSANDVLVVIGDESVLLIGAANLDTVNIQGVYYEPGGVPVLGDDVHGYISPNGEYNSSDDIPQSDWLINSHTSLHSGSENYNGHLIIDSEITENDELLIVTDGLYRKCSSVTYNNHLWQSMITTQQYLDEDGKTFVQPHYWFISRVEPTVGKQVILGVDSKYDVNTPVVIYKNDEQIAEIDLSDYVDDVIEECQKCENELMSQNPDISNAVNFSHQPAPPSVAQGFGVNSNSFIAFTYARVSSFRVQPNGDWDAIIETAAYGYCFMYFLYDGSILTSSKDTNPTSPYNVDSMSRDDIKSMYSTLNYIDVLINRGHYSSMFNFTPHSYYPYYNGIRYKDKYDKADGDEDDDYEIPVPSYEEVLDKFLYYKEALKFKFYVWDPVIFSASIVFHVHNGEIVDKINVNSGGGVEVENLGWDHIDFFNSDKLQVTTPPRLNQDINGNYTCRLSSDWSYSLKGDVKLYGHGAVANGLCFNKDSDFIDKLESIIDNVSTLPDKLDSSLSSDDSDNNLGSYLSEFADNVQNFVDTREQRIATFLSNRLDRFLGLSSPTEVISYVLSTPFEGLRFMKNLIIDENPFISLAKDVYDVSNLIPPIPKGHPAIVAVQYALYAYDIYDFATTVNWDALKSTISSRVEDIEYYLQSVSDKPDEDSIIVDFSKAGLKDSYEIICSPYYPMPLNFEKDTTITPSEHRAINLFLYTENVVSLFACNRMNFVSYSDIPDEIKMYLPIWLHLSRNSSDGFFRINADYFSTGDESHKLTVYGLHNDFLCYEYNGQTHYLSDNVKNFRFRSFFPDKELIQKLLDEFKQSVQN